jgi:hypothetical protein
MRAPRKRGQIEEQQGLAEPDLTDTQKLGLRRSQTRDWWRKARHSGIQERCLGEAANEAIENKGVTWNLVLGSMSGVRGPCMTEVVLIWKEQVDTLSCFAVKELREAKPSLEGEVRGRVFVSLKRWKLGTWGSHL